MLGEPTDSEVHEGAQRPQWIAIVRHPEQLETAAVARANGYYVPGTHCRQGDILLAVAASGKPVWIERGSFLAPTDVAHVTKRFSDPSVVTLVEAGSHFGYDDRVLDPRALALYESWGLKLSFSITDLLAGDGAGSLYRPQWAEDPTHLRLFLKTFLRMRALWKAGVVVKNYSRKTDAAAASYVTLITQELADLALATKEL